MVAAAEGISTPESRERFLHSGLHGFHAASPRCFASEVYPDDHSGPTVIGMVHKSVSSVESVDQDSELRIWNLEGTERVALSPYSNSQLLTPSFSTAPLRVLYVGTDANIRCLWRS